MSQKTIYGPKGELDPEALLVFEYENNFTRDMNNIIEMRNLIKQVFNLEKIYHTLHG